MRHVYWARIRAGRLLVVLLAALAYFTLLALDVPHLTSSHATKLYAHFLPWVFFSFTAFVALMFLAVGSLVWLYARDRLVAQLLFAFTFAMTVIFATQTGDVPGNYLLQTVSGLSSTLALSLLSTLLLLFPNNYLSVPSQSGMELAELEDRKHSGRRRKYFHLLLRGYLSLLILLGLVVIPYSFPPLRTASWLDTIDNIYYVVGMTGILITIITSYRQSPSLRARQQQRLFVGGIILAFAPILLLTVLPDALGWTYLNGQFSSITIGLLPLALGYSILRYQVLVFDAYIRRAVAWLVGTVGLAILGYLVVTLLGVFLSGLMYIMSVAVFMAILGPFVWWLARVVTGRLFFSENLHYRRLVESADVMNDETFDLNQASSLLTQATINAFETQEICLFILDEDSGYYRIHPPLKDDDEPDAPRRSLVQHLLNVIKPSMEITIDWLEAKGPLIKRLQSAKRPLVLSEACNTSEELPTGLARYLATSPTLESTEPILAPVLAQGKMIGVLALGERGDHQQYAGPDFEAIHLILSRFSPVVETARVMLKLRAAYEGLKEVDRMKDQFIITASHELRTPLTAVQGYIELLAEYNLTLEAAARADFIAKANRGCDELTLMVGNIMDASRVQIDADNVTLRQVSLAESVQHVLEILEAVTKREERNIQVDIPSDVLVMADDMRLRQVLLNLVSNALKYSPQGSGFEISMAVDDEQVALNIRDHGLGVPLEDQGRLFERFVRLERDMNSPIRGAGLGLYISKQLVEAMGGRIWVESPGIPGEGSTFAFTLNRARAAKEKQRAALEHQEV